MSKLTSTEILKKLNEVIVSVKSEDYDQISYNLDRAKLLVVRAWVSEARSNNSNDANLPLIGGRFEIANDLFKGISCKENSISPDKKTSTQINDELNKIIECIKNKDNYNRDMHKSIKEKLKAIYDWRETTTAEEMDDRLDSFAIGVNYTEAKKVFDEAGIKLALDGVKNFASGLLGNKEEPKPEDIKRLTIEELLEKSRANLARIKEA